MKFSKLLFTSAFTWTLVTREKRKLKFPGNTNASLKLRVQNEIKFHNMRVKPSYNSKNRCDELAKGK
jgi:hypothetical protein